MKNLILDFGGGCDLFKCPEYIVDDIDNYRIKFLNWLEDKSNNHAYWNNDKTGLSYSSNAFIFWLNNYVITEENCKVHEIEVDYNRAEFENMISEGTPRIYF